MKLKTKGFCLELRNVYKQMIINRFMELNIKTTLTEEEENRLNKLKVLFNEKTNSKLIRKIIMLKFILE